MSGPSSARGWFAWSCYVREYQGRPHSPRLEYEGYSDRRVNDRRETVISVTMALERATDGNGAGKLLLDHYVNEIPWFVFSEDERWILENTIRRFRRELQAAGFIPEDVRDIGK